MLHEMLTGTPPRGAWLPASAREGVDVRIDGIIRRAMDPDPARTLAGREGDGGRARRGSRQPAALSPARRW